MKPMKWSSALSENQSFKSAIEECCRKIEKDLQGPPDLALVFVSAQHAKSYPQINAELNRLLKAKVLIGCSAGGVIGGGKEVEQRAAITLTCAIMPDVQIKPFHVSNDALPDMDAPPQSWRELVGLNPDREFHFVFLADPFSVNIDKFIMGMDYAFPKSTKVGGLASSGKRPQENLLFLNRNNHREGLVGIALSGNIAVDSVVAQGCRPIGEPILVTSCDHNILLELDGKPPLKVLEEIFESLSPRDQQLLRTSLFLGMVMDPTKSSFSHGDFLIRNIVGADPDKGILAVGAELREGQTVQFHLRDAKTSAHDLEVMLSKCSSQNEKATVKGSLLFSCLGRGIYLYGTPDHDSKVFKENFGNVPLGGFFCNGEVGPVKNTTYIHGYTSCFGIFKEKASGKAS